MFRGNLRCVVRVAGLTALLAGAVGPTAGAAQPPSNPCAYVSNDDVLHVRVYNDPNAAGLERKLYGLGADVTLYNGTVYVVRAHRSIAVRVVPQDHAASYNEVEGFAKVVVRRLR